MAPQNVLFDWNHARAFLVTAQEGSLSAAARALNTTQPTVGRQIAALEQELGAVLFDRVGRALVLTDLGTELLEYVQAMGEAANGLSLAASGSSQSIAGQVSIAATDGMTVYHLPPIIAKLREAAPEIEIKLVSSNALQDLRRREADIAIRHVRPHEPELIARRIRETKGHLYAATEYLERHGRPQSLEDLANVDFVGFEDPDQVIAYLANLDIPLRRDNIKVHTNNGVAIWEMVKRGLGLTVMLRDLGDITPEVECLFEDQIAIAVPIWLTTHRELHTSRRIRLVFDFLADALA